MKNKKLSVLFIATILISLIIIFFAYLIWVSTALLGHLFILHGIIVIWLILNALYLVYGLIHETINVMMTIDKENNKEGFSRILCAHNNMGECFECELENQKEETLDK